MFEELQYKKGSLLMSFLDGSVMDNDAIQLEESHLQNRTKYHVKKRLSSACKDVTESSQALHFFKF